MLWVALAEARVGRATDMTEDVVREVALPTGLVDTKVARDRRDVVGPAAGDPGDRAIAQRIGSDAMKIFLTGATGFIGGAVALALQERGDEVRALVRNREKAQDLEAAGVALVPGGLSDVDTIASALKGCDAAIHNAAVYEVGIKKSEHPAMYAANVEGTENVLGAALRAKTPKVVYVSTVGAFGNTKGQVVDETYEHTGEGYTSYYEETKVLAHQAARRLIDEQGLPCVIVQPGGVYGPEDHSAIGDLIERFAKGKLPAMMFPELGFNLVHRTTWSPGSCSPSTRADRESSTCSAARSPP